MKVLTCLKSRQSYLYKGEGDFHSKEGKIEEKTILEHPRGIIENHLGKRFAVCDANDKDKELKMKRGPQILTPKDLGYIAARTGLSKHSKVVEAGAGSGAATLFFSKIAKEVQSYEIREDHIKIVQTNLNSFCTDKNVNLILGDIAEKIEEEKDIDLLFLDLPEPVRILEKNLSKSVNSGHYVVCYLPSMTQVSELVNYCKDTEQYLAEEVSEIIFRKWKVSGNIAHPEHQKETDHTAFLVFVRVL